MDMGLVAYGAGTFIVYALISQRLRRSPISGPMFFAAAGLIAAVLDLGGMGVGSTSNVVKIILEFTLAIVLFTDATTTNVRSWKIDGDLPTRLLVVASPLIIVSGAIAAVLLVPEIDLLDALIVATILAPTDAALGKPVISNTRVPLRIREALNIESGLNDGIVLPVLIFFLSIAETTGGESFVPLFVESVGIALAVGVSIGWITGRLVVWSSDRGWIAPMWRQIAAAATALAAFVATDELGGSGFIAAFVGGLLFGRQVLRAYPDVADFSEDLSEVASMLSFLLFGGYLLHPVLGDITPVMVVYGMLSLTLVRMLPVAAAMIGTHSRWPTLAYLGWFGPRGLASLVFAGILLEETALEADHPVLITITVTVALSILLHGVTANGGARAYADWYHRQEDDHEDMHESRDVTAVSRRRTHETRAPRPRADAGGG